MVDIERLSREICVYILINASYGRLAMQNRIPLDSRAGLIATPDEILFSAGERDVRHACSAKLQPVSVHVRSIQGTVTELTNVAHEMFEWRLLRSMLSFLELL